MIAFHAITMTTTRAFIIVDLKVAVDVPFRQLVVGTLLLKISLWRAYSPPYYMMGNFAYKWVFRVLAQGLYLAKTKWDLHIAVL